MKQIELKRDALVLVPYLVVLVALFGLVFAGKITWPECLAGLALLNVPAIFGMAKTSTKSTDAVVLIICALAFGGATACGYGKPACAVVDVAKANCDLWIRYLAEDGTIKEVQLTREEATALARSTAKKRASERDGGTP